MIFKIASNPNYLRFKAEELPANASKSFGQGRKGITSVIINSLQSGQTA